MRDWMDDFKVAYTTLGGGVSVAYMTCQMVTKPRVWLAEDKYTDKEIFVQGTNEGKWVEVQASRIS